MANLLRLLVELATDDDSRRRFLAAADDRVAELDRSTPGGITGEDVTAAAAVAIRQLEATGGTRPDLDPSDPDPDEDPNQTAARHLVAWCDAVDRIRGTGADTSAAGLPADESTARPEDAARLPGDALPPAPPEATRHLRAVAGEVEDGRPWFDLPGEGDGESDQPSDDDAATSTPAGSGDDVATAGIDPDHPSAGAPGSSRPRLAPVPDPEGGFEFGMLEMVALRHGIPDAGIEPGALATVVAVRPGPEPAYEVAVSAPDGATRFVGLVPRDAVDRPS